MANLAQSFANLAGAAGGTLKAIGTSPWNAVKPLFNRGGNAAAAAAQAAAAAPTSAWGQVWQKIGGPGAAQAAQAGMNQVAGSPIVQRVTQAAVDTGKQMHFGGRLVGEAAGGAVGLAGKGVGGIFKGSANAALWIVKQPIKWAVDLTTLLVGGVGTFYRKAPLLAVPVTLGVGALGVNDMVQKSRARETHAEIAGRIAALQSQPVSFHNTTTPDDALRMQAALEERRAQKAAAAASAPAPGAEHQQPEKIATRL